MKRPGFWDDEADERDALDESAAQLDSVAWRMASPEAKVEQLARANQMLRRELAELRVVVRALADVLVRSGAVDRPTLDARVLHALAVVDTPSMPQVAPTMPRDHGGAAYRDNGLHAATPEQAERLVRCTLCNTLVPARETTVTEDDTFCAECFRRRRLSELGD